ncbi:MAG: glycosyltransferase, partial [Janthinobacterium lividum]
FIGRLDPLKGVEMLLRVVAALAPGTVTLAVAGRGEPDYEATLQADLPPGVRFLGQVAPAKFFPQVDLLVVPSVWEDPFPRVFHEALAFGVPSLVSPLGGLPEAVEPGRTGFVAASADDAGFLSVIRALLAGSWASHAMREACLAAAADYAPGRIVDQYEAVLLAASRREAPPAGSGEPWQADADASPAGPEATPPGAAEAGPR